MKYRNRQQFGLIGGSLYKQLPFHFRRQKAMLVCSLRRRPSASWPERASIAWLGVEARSRAHLLNAPAIDEGDIGVLTLGQLEATAR